MIETSKLDQAFGRFEAALRQFEAALARQQDQLRRDEVIKGEAEALRLDRSRLAQELDNSLVKTRKLERTNREIAERLDSAIGTVRTMLDGGDEA